LVLKKAVPDFRNILSVLEGRIIPEFRCEVLDQYGSPCMPDRQLILENVLITAVGLGMEDEEPTRFGIYHGAAFAAEGYRWEVTTSSPTSP
jgi:hypothetical protein